MSSFTNNASNQTCISNLPEKFGRKISVFGKTETKSELTNSLFRTFPTNTPLPSCIMPRKIPNLIIG